MSVSTQPAARLSELVCTAGWVVPLPVVAVFLGGTALARKAWLFARSDRDGERAAAIYSLTETCLCRARHEPLGLYRAPDYAELAPPVDSLPLVCVHIIPA